MNVSEKSTRPRESGEGYRSVGAGWLGAEHGACPCGRRRPGDDAAGSRLGVRAAQQLARSPNSARQPKNALRRPRKRRERLRLAAVIATVQPLVAPKGRSTRWTPDSPPWAEPSSWSARLPTDP